MTPYIVATLSGFGLVFVAFAPGLFSAWWMPALYVLGAFACFAALSLPLAILVGWLLGGNDDGD